MNCQIQEKKLKHLRSEIIDKILKECWEDVWFFPSYNRVKGYLGTQDIIFLSINPSTGVFPSWHDRQYYRQLRRYGFAGAHLTDVFKQREKTWKTLVNNRTLREEAKGFLLKEIKTIKPILIVLIGRSYEKFYNRILKEMKISVETISIGHYAFRFRSHKQNRAMIRKGMKLLKKKYDELSKIKSHFP